MSTIIPDIELRLPANWSWFQRNQSVLALGPETGEGALHISAPATGRSWRDCDHLEPMIRTFVERARLGEVLRVEVGEISYGRFVSAECISEDHGDVCAWLVVPETHDPLCITWIAETPTQIGRAARRLVTLVRPGLFSSAVAGMVGMAQEKLASTDSIMPFIYFLCDKTGEIVAVDFSSLGDERSLIQGIRDQRARLNASIVIRGGRAQIRFPDRPSELMAFVYAESSLRRKQFFLPFSAGGRKVYEVDADDQPVSGFFGDCRDGAP